jgi:hypothetical protein
MFQVMPWLTPADRPTARAWAQMEYLADAVYIELKTNGVFNGEREARRLLDDYRKLRSVQLGFSLALGMAPSARRSLKDLPGEVLNLEAMRDESAGDA